MPLIHDIIVRVDMRGQKQRRPSFPLIPKVFAVKSHVPPAVLGFPRGYARTILQTSRGMSANWAGLAAGSFCRRPPARQARRFIVRPSASFAWAASVSGWSPGDERVNLLIGGG